MNLVLSIIGGCGFCSAGKNFGISWPCGRQGALAGLQKRWNERSWAKQAQHRAADGKIVRWACATKAPQKILDSLVTFSSKEKVTS